MEQNFVSAVVYLNNDEHTVIPFLNILADVLKHNFKSFEIICVDDHCSDESVQKVKEFVAGNGDIVLSILHMSFYQGLEHAMNAGVDLSIGDFVFEFDIPVCDYSPDVIMQAYFQCINGQDVVSATPESKQRKSSVLFYALFNSFSNSEYQLRTEAFRVVSRRVINRINSSYRILTYRKALYSQSGLKCGRIYYSPLEKKKALDKNTSHNRRTMAVDAMMVFTDAAYRIAFFLSIAMMVLAVGVGLYAIILYFGSNKPIEGWTTTILFLSLAFFGIFMVMAIMTKYLSMIVTLMTKRQHYTIESIEKLSS